MEILINKNNQVVIRLTNGAEVIVREYGDDDNMASVEVNDIHKVDDRACKSPISTASIKVNDYFGINNIITHTEEVTSKSIKRSKRPSKRFNYDVTKIKLNDNDYVGFSIFHDK